MKTMRLTAAVACASLLTLGGTAFAADNSHDAYNRAFLGAWPSAPEASRTAPDMDSMGKAAYGTQSSTAEWSGHDAYNRAFLGAWPRKAEADSMGKAAYGAGGASSWSSDGNAAYHSAFRGD